MIENFFLRFKKNQNSQNNLLAKSFQKHYLFFFYGNPEGSYEGLKKAKILQKSQNEKIDGPKKGGKKIFLKKKFLIPNSD